MQIVKTKDEQWIFRKNRDFLSIIISAFAFPFALLAFLITFLGAFSDYTIRCERLKSGAGNCTVKSVVPLVIPTTDRMYREMPRIEEKLRRKRGRQTGRERTVFYLRLGSDSFEVSESAATTARNFIAGADEKITLYPKKIFVFNIPFVCLIFLSLYFLAFLESLTFRQCSFYFSIRHVSLEENCLFIRRRREASIDEIEITYREKTQRKGKSVFACVELHFLGGQSLVLFSGARETVTTRFPGGRSIIPPSETDRTVAVRDKFHRLRSQLGLPPDNSIPH